ncbi:c-type cytochrome [Rhizobium sp. 9140]|uniref:c-type cytochrome n=1 Tax=Rhizobium sp. 9140 TaxID=1761900 RepID=UPI0007914C76|nr:c-type cytochrome [Rhizobium sp. 9140]CZT37158.1 Cytochrome c553 [Rhizobium sp. 9140]
MLIRWRHLLAALVALPVLGLMVAWLGIIPVGASGGHWATTDWFLHWVMRNSVRTAALDTTTPPLSDAAMLPLAAGHFETGCALCHGSPVQKRSGAALAMLPPPPDLKEVVPTWTDAQLFEIVQHGVRFTGMPYWPARDREDEVWAMVAFLRQLPEMDGQTYLQLSGLATPVEIGTLQPPALACDSCHAETRLDGHSLIPILAGQSEAYLLESLRAYAAGARPSGVMQVAISGLEPDSFPDLARRYAAQARRMSPPAQSKPERLDHGRRLAEAGDAGRRIPACLTCHDKGDGNPAFPVLSGQSAPYLESQLRLFAAGTRGGGAYAHLMIPAAENLEERDIEALAAYFSSR